MNLSIFLIITFIVVKGNIITLPLYGNVYKYGYYFIKISVGLPLRQQQTLIVDTGSSLTGFACVDCINCGTHENEPFNINLSTTSNIIECKKDSILINEKDIKNKDNYVRTNKNYQNYIQNFLENKCIYDIKYSEGSHIFGYFFEDFVEFENGLSSKLGIKRKFDEKFVFGCNIIEDSLFKHQKASGILGLANYSNIGGMNQIINFIFQSNEVRGIYPEKIISIFFEANGGKLTFGSTYFDQINIWDKQFEIYNVTRCVDDERYCAYISKIEVDSVIRKEYTATKGNTFKAIFDTGTTISIFPAKLFKNITRSLFNTVSRYYPKISGYDEKDGLICWKILNEISIDIFPDIKVMFKNNHNQFTEQFVINWSPKSYLYLNKILESNSKVYCLGIASNNLLNLKTRDLNNGGENPSNINEIVLGATFFIYKEITFFLSENKIMIRDNYSNINNKNNIVPSMNFFRNKNIGLNSNEGRNYDERKIINIHKRYKNSNIFTRRVIKRYKALRYKNEFWGVLISLSLITIVLLSTFTIYQKLLRKFKLFEENSFNLRQYVSLQY
ncbi:membrane associated aspartyl protease [Cryptosporidium ubiquitum]|uniref:Membrane associated aspartyl protease n=1 Tax=Cryptosporidium ubiquitum TaxID=857276 RepID=A0A1J4MGR2_9CRYT|nr:membrane associated aspartyl protease [Cryptosporidium ubiquitum]OII72045.1 membrane associated aspartyl protease [Cryptosporidium ubiquitum]